MSIGSKEVASYAVTLSATADRDEERKLRAKLDKLGFRSAAVNFGGEFITSVNKAIEHTIVAARRENVIGDSHSEEGAVAGAAREALSQLITKSLGLNIGGKIAIVRYEDHISVAMFFGIGLLHLNDVAIGLGHRAI